MDTISVIVPAYNIGPYLGRSLDSLLAQSHPQLEIIVVDDGSEDNTADVMREYAEKSEKIHVIFKDNGGVTSARLRGVQESTGDWIAFMDGDDYVEPQMYARLLENARNAGADISHCGHQVHYSDGRIEYVHQSGTIHEQDHRTGLWELLDNRDVSMSLCTKLYRRALFEGLDDWMDPTIRNNEDLLMNYYLFDRAQRGVFEGNCPYHYLLRNNSASCRGITEAVIFDPIRVRRLLLERAAPDMKNDVQQAMLRNLLFAYAQVDVNPQRNQYGIYRQRVRELLQKERASFHLLSLRNRVLANMICRAPWSFHLAYGAYVAMFQREEQH